MSSSISDVFPVVLQFAGSMGLCGASGRYERLGVVLSERPTIFGGHGLGCLGGETGIRTLDTFDRILDFESSAFDHSAISPLSKPAQLYQPPLL